MVTILALLLLTALPSLAAAQVVDADEIAQAALQRIRGRPAIPRAGTDTQGPRRDLLSSGSADALTRKTLERINRPRLALLLRPPPEIEARLVDAVRRKAGGEAPRVIAVERLEEPALSRVFPTRDVYVVRCAQPWARGPRPATEPWVVVDAAAPVVFPPRDEGAVLDFMRSQRARTRGEALSLARVLCVFAGGQPLEDAGGVSSDRGLPRNAKEGEIAAPSIEMLPDGSARVSMFALTSSRNGTVQRFEAVVGPSTPPQFSRSFFSTRGF